MKVLAVAVVAISVAAGLVLVGSPSEERARKLDERRVEDLRRLSSAVDLYRSRRGSLPASLTEASRETGDAQTEGDPVTGRPYPYQVVGADTYELCAGFQRSSGHSATSNPTQRLPFPPGVLPQEASSSTASRSESRRHRRGSKRWCLSRWWAQRSTVWGRASRRRACLPAVRSTATSAMLQMEMEDSSIQPAGCPCCRTSMPPSNATSFTTLGARRCPQART